MIARAVQSVVKIGIRRQLNHVFHGPLLRQDDNIGIALDQMERLDLAVMPVRAHVTAGGDSDQHLVELVSGILVRADTCAASWVAQCAVTNEFDGRLVQTNNIVGRNIDLVVDFF